MHNILEHIFKKRAPETTEISTIHLGGEGHVDIPVLDTPLLDRKIHQDLDTLVEDHISLQMVTHASAKSIASRANASPDSTKGFRPLKPNSFRPPVQKKVPPMTVLTDERIVPAPAQTTVIAQMPVIRESPKRPLAITETSFSTSTVSSDSRNTSIGTFGTRSPWHIHDHAALQTSSSEGSHRRRMRSLSEGSRSGTRSYESMTKRSRGSSMSSASRDTFGRSSPNQSPTNIHRPRKTSEEAPPLPPLDHPAFLAVGLQPLRDALPEHESQRPTLARNEHSPPVLQKRSSGRDVLRQRTRTSSSGHSTSFAAAAQILAFESPKLVSLIQPSPTLVSRQRSRSSTHSRRLSAELRANRTTSTSSSQDFKVIPGNWEAEVSKAMVKLSLENCHHEREYQDGTSSRKGNTRGDCARRTHSLGSPFFLSDAHSYCPPATLNNLTARYNFATTRNTGRSKKSSTMSQKQSPSHSSRSTNASTRTRTPSPPYKNPSTPRRSSPLASTSHLVPPSVSITGPTPDSSPIFPTEVSQQPPNAESSKGTLIPPTTPTPLRQPTTSMSKGKRKAEEVEGGGTPPKDDKEQHTTFAEDPRPHRPSGGSSNAPSSYHHRKRARLAPTPESRPGSRLSADGQTAKTTGSWSSKTSQQQQFQPPSRSVTPRQHPPRAPSRGSMSQVSIPISALISPHAPSVTSSGVFHMRDPRKPGPIQTTRWSLSLPSGRAEPGEGWRGWVERGGSPLHAWMFFIGFVIFPLWWIASLLSVPRTRQLGGGEAEKGVVLDDPQLEYDSYSWRKRCRIMAVVSVFTYIPFIVLVAVFASR